MCTWFSASWRRFRHDRKCLFSCIYNPQITISPTSLFSANFNGNRVKNHPQPWTCPLRKQSMRTKGVLPLWFTTNCCTVNSSLCDTLNHHEQAAISDALSSDPKIELSLCGLEKYDLMQLHWNLPVCGTILFSACVHLIVLVCVCVRVFVHASMPLCVCVCVCVRVRERQRQRQSLCVCLCIPFMCNCNYDLHISRN